LPVTLPIVDLDRSEADCGAGWNFCGSLVDAAKIAGFWANGRPARCLVVETIGEVVTRAPKSRTSQLQLVRLCSEVEIQTAMRALVTPWAAAEHVDGLVAEQWAWYVALGRPAHDPARVEAALRAALDACGLSDWQLRRFDAARAAWDARAARAAWDARAARAAWDARAARAAWDARAARDAWDAWAAWAAWAARDARDARAAWDAWDAWDAWAARAAWDARAARAAWDAWDAWDAWAAWDARTAWAALAVYTTVSHGWLKGYKADQLTIGIRDAYQAGLGIALPTGPKELGYSLDVDG
jgi:hypothetical protein